MRVVTNLLPDRWDAFVDRHPAGWFWHRRAWVDYQLAYRASAQEASFAVVDDDGRVLAVVPLVVSRPAGASPELSYAGDPLPEPLLASCKRALGDLVAATVWDVALRVGVSCRRSAPSPFGPPGDWAVWRESQRVVDLDAMSWSDLRKSYRSVVNGADKEYGLKFATEVGTGAFALYQRLHAQLSRHPRADATYRMQAEWLDEGRAAVVTAERGDVCWGAAYWVVYKGCAYYASGAYAARDVGPAVVWASLNRLRTFMGVQRASLGWQGRAATEKERGIEFFKRGFGGADVPCPIAVQEF